MERGIEQRIRAQSRVHILQLHVHILEELEAFGVSTHDISRGNPVQHARYSEAITPREKEEAQRE